MESPVVFPKKALSIVNGKANCLLLERGCSNFRDACFYIKAMPYGNNKVSNDPFILFEDGYGTCYTKHSVAAICAKELGLKVEKHLCFYGMTENIVSGLQLILDKYNMPFIPASHCFLKYGDRKVDLTEGNCNGKSGPIDEYLKSFPVDPYLSADEKVLLLDDYIKDELIKGPLSHLRFVEIKEAQKEAKKQLEERLSCAVDSM